MFLRWKGDAEVRIRWIAGILVAIATACGSDGTDADEFRPLGAGDLAPQFAAAGLDGDTVSLASLRGTPVLLNVWATWCPPCREEMPGLQALHERHGPDGLRVVGVSVDGGGDGSAVREFLAAHGITFTILHDPQDRVARQFRTMGVPETFLIDADGRIVQRWIGKFDPMAPAVLERVEALLP
jgi:cytochrome c biogenesis protein CcmG, thiol:disulfide interchange protein DsbE